MVKKNVTMTIDEDVLNDFKSYCRQNGMKISTRIERLMADGLNEIKKKA